MPVDAVLGFGGGWCACFCLWAGPCKNLSMVATVGYNVERDRWVMLQYQSPKPKKASQGPTEEATTPSSNSSRLGNAAMAEKLKQQAPTEKSPTKATSKMLPDWAANDGKEKAVVDGVSRPDRLKSHQKGALIGSSDISLNAAEDGHGTEVAKVPSGTGAELKKSRKGRALVQVRVGSAAKEGWIDASLFSDQPGLSKDDDHPELQSDYVFHKFDGDQSPQNPTGKQATQGFLGNCFLIGSLAAVANASPQIIKDMVKYDPKKGSYTVRFYEEQGQGKQVPVYIEVDSYLPVSAGDTSDPVFAGDAGGPMWAAIVEKAYAKWKGGYDVIGEGGVGESTMQEITGGKSQSKSMSSMKEADVIPYFTQAKKDGKAIYAGTKDGKKADVQAPFRGSGDGDYTADIKQTHQWNEILPNTFRVQDVKGKAGSVMDVGEEGEAEGVLKGSHVKSGSVEYKKNKAQLKFKPGFAPASASDLEVVFQYEGVIDLNKFVIANHAYAFEGVVEGNLLQFYNPWGTYQPKPLTPQEFLNLYDSLAVNTPPAGKTAGKS